MNNDEFRFLFNFDYFLFRQVSNQFYFDFVYFSEFSF